MSTSTSGERPGEGSSTVPPSTTSRSTLAAGSTAPWRKTASTVSIGNTLPHLASPGGGFLPRTNCCGGGRDSAGRGGSEAAPASPPARGWSWTCGGSARALRRGSLGTPSAGAFSPSPRRAQRDPFSDPGAGGLDRAAPSARFLSVGTCPAAVGLRVGSLNPPPSPMGTGTLPCSSRLTCRLYSPQWRIPTLALPRPRPLGNRCPPRRAADYPCLSQLISLRELELPRAKSHLSPLTCAADRR